MKRFFSFLLLFCLVVCSFAACNKSDGEIEATTTSETTADTTPAATTIAPEPSETPVVFNDEELYVGYAKENISPRNPDGTIMRIPMPGNSDTRICTALDTELYATCTAFRDDEGSIALIYSVDTTNFANDVATNIRSQISAETGIITRRIVLNATHCHTAPTLSWSSSDPVIAEYRDLVVSAMKKAAQRAIEDLTLCEALYVGQIDAAGLSFIRRYITDETGNLVHETEPDPYMPVARFVREGKKDVILANWAAHTDTLSSSKKMFTASADYYEAFRRYAEEKTNAYISIHMAASGDVNPMSKIPDEYQFPGTAAYGMALGRRLVEQIDSLERVEIKSAISSKSSTLTLTVNHTTDHLLEQAKEVRALYSSDREHFEEKLEEYGFATIHEADAIITRASLVETQDCSVWVVSVGNIVFAAVPYEMFAHNGKNIKAASEFDLTFVCGYSNGSFGYIASDYAYENGEYEVYKCRYVKGSAEILQDKIIELIGQLYRTEK